VVLAGLVFAEITDQPHAVLEAIMALVAFVLASAAVYIVNDIRDVAADRQHPLKRHRPLASAEIEPATAMRVAGVLAVAGLALATVVTPLLATIIAAYLVLMGAYTLGLKRVAILDVMVIAVGFVLRAVGGAIAVAVPISPWLLVCAFLLALFLGFGKRRAELIGLGLNAAHHRVALAGYTGPLLDQLVRITAGAALVTYATYTVVSTSVPDNGAMLLTVPFVAFAIFRYLYLIYGRGLGGSPESLLFRDRWLLGSVALWGVLALVVMRAGG
jgi:4-hydroxybenzoate polyprenyltransferase